MIPSTPWTPVWGRRWLMWLSGWFTFVITVSFLLSTASKVINPPHDKSMKLTRLHTSPYKWFVEVDKTTPAFKCQQLLAPTSLVTPEILLFAAVWQNYLANGEKYLILLLFSSKIYQPKCSSFIIIWSMGLCRWKEMPFIDLQARLLPPAVTRLPLTRDLPWRLSPPRGQCETLQLISEVET